MRQKVTVATALVRARALLRFSSNTSTTSSINIFALTTTMGWFWGSSSSGVGNKSQDPLRGLDPSLRDFLAKESPVKYSSSDPPPPPAPKPIPTPTSSSSRNPAAPEESSGEDTEPKVPPQSLFKDGRYAHLWKGYQPQEEIEAAGKSDQEKIDDVLEGYKYRKAEIGRAALENCALEQWQVNECFRNGGWASRLTMCRTENRELERCYLMQSVCLIHLMLQEFADTSAEISQGVGIPFHVRSSSRARREDPNARGYFISSNVGTGGGD
jgi:hypothetical protein